MYRPDHVIEDNTRFLAATRQAAEVAGTGRLVLLGIKPTRAHTGYGYIEAGSAIGATASQALAVKSFTEKPTLQTAEQYVANGNYYWNSGIFVFHCETYLKELENLEPELSRAARQALDAGRNDLEFFRLDEEAYAKASNISVDYAVMERTTSAAMLPIDVGWSDVGSWEALWEIADHDPAGNATKGDVVLQDTTACYVHAERGLVATIGLKDLIVVQTPDAVLVADKARSQDVTSVVERLKAAGRSEPDQNIRTHRPWGFFETLSIAPRFQVKLLHVRPGGKLSMQMHHHRSEHWIVVKGNSQGNN